jgi:CYTH domain-containing protein
MKREIEKKYLLAREPSGFENLPRKIIRQGYLAITPSRQIRVRAIVEPDGKELYFFAVKDEGGSERIETEFEISRDQFDALWPLTQGLRIEKERRYLADAEGVFEIDLYLGRHAGLCIVEREFHSREEAEQFSPPDWIGAEVTGRREFSNTALAASPGRLD